MYIFKWNSQLVGEAEYIRILQPYLPFQVELHQPFWSGMQNTSELYGPICLFKGNYINLSGRGSRIHQNSTALSAYYSYRDKAKQKVVQNSFLVGEAEYIRILKQLSKNAFKIKGQYNILTKLTVDKRDGSNSKADKNK
jgi:hypothetical protein